MGNISKRLLVLFACVFIFTSCVKPAGETDQVRSTSGNINNGSRYVMYDGWIYYTEFEGTWSYHGVDSASHFGGFWKMKPDFSQRHRIAIEDAESLFVVGSKIYTKTGFVYNTVSKSYTKAEWAKKVSADGSYAFLILDRTVYFGGNAIDLDGKNLRSFAEDSTVVRMDAYKGWLYFNDPNLEKYSLCKIKPDGTEKTIVATGVINDFVIEENKVYYPNSYDNDMLYVLDLNTGASSKLANIPVTRLNYHDGKLYYLSYKISERNTLSEIYRINTDGSDNERIVSSSAGLGQLSILDGWLYYGGLSDDVDGPHLRMSLSTGEVEELKIDVKFADPVTNNQEYIKGDKKMSFVAEKDGWLYFSKVSSDADRGIYRVKPDGSASYKISGEVATSLMIVEDWIYFSNYNYRMMLFRMHLDGTNVEMVSNKNSTVAILKDEWIYVSTPPELFRVRTDSTGYMKLSNDVRFRIAGDNIIISDEGDAGSNLPGIFKMDLDGKNKIRIYTGFNSVLDVSDDWIYFIKHDGFGNPDGFTYRMKLDGSSLSVIDDLGGFSIMVPYHDWYYAVSDDLKSITRLGADGTERSVIINLPIRLENIDVVNDRIYITTYDYESIEFSVASYDLDGKNKIEFKSLYLHG